jgi:hypothetical protein
MKKKYIKITGTYIFPSAAASDSTPLRSLYLSSILILKTKFICVIYVPVLAMFAVLMAALPGQVQRIGRPCRYVRQLLIVGCPQLFPARCSGFDKEGVGQRHRTAQQAVDGIQLSGIHRGGDIQYTCCRVNAADYSCAQACG